MKILIIGSEGFIGRHLINYYLHNENQVTGADIFETNTTPYSYFKISRLSPEYEELLQQSKFDFCINAAGSGNVNYSMTHPVGDFESNCLDTVKILDGIRRHQPICKYLHISSAAVYGNPNRFPVAEGDALSPISPYGWHKLISEKICKEYSLMYDIPIAIVRPFSVFGPGLKKQLFWDVYQKWKSRKQPNDPIQLWGTGMESRDFIFISDLVKAFDTILSNGDFDCEIYNVGSGFETYIREAAGKLIYALDNKATLEFNGFTRGGDPQKWSVDITKLTSLGFKPLVGLDMGINEIVRWLKDSQ